MKTSFQEFDRVSKAEWLEKISRDLKGAQPSSLDWEIEKDLAMSPFAGPEDIPSSSTVIRGPWEIGDVFEVMSGHESAVNGEILEALNGGVQALHLHLKDQVSVEELLQEVFVGMLHMTIDLTGCMHPEKVLEGFQNYFTKHQPKSLSIRGTQDIHDRHFAVQARDGRKLSAGIADLFEAIIRRSDALDTFDAVVHIGHAYFIEIARLRAIQLVHRNVGLALGAFPEMTLEVHFADSALSADADQNMIRAGSMTFSAILGGADRIYTSVTPPGTTPHAAHRRFARNIHHLVQYESDIAQFEDAISGSYFIESLTRKIVEESWTQLKKNVKSDGR